MPVAALPLPILVLAIGAAFSRLAGGRSRSAGQVVTAASFWIALAVVVTEWAIVRAPLTAAYADLGYGARLSLRLDAVSVAVAAFVLLPAALVTTFRRIPGPALAALAGAASLLTVEASGLLLAALALGMTLNLVALLLIVSGSPPPASWRLRSDAAWLAAAWAGAALAGVAGTAQFADVPVSALTAPVFALVACAAVLVAGAVPWRPWTAAVWVEGGSRVAAIPLALLPPLGFDLLLRMYQAGGGRLPGTGFNLALAILGAAAAATAAIRAQAAPTRDAFLAEVVPGAAGFTLLSLALGTPLGVIAGVAGMAATALLAALVPLVGPGGTGAAAALALAAGAPPTLVFAARLLTVQAALEANEVEGYLAIAAVAAWTVAVAGTARALRLPADEDPPPGRGPVIGATIAGVGLAAGGALVGVFLAAVALPAASAIMSVPNTAVTGLPVAVDTASGRWPAIAMGGLGLVLVVAVVLAARTRLVVEPAPSPALIDPWWSGVAGRTLAWLDRLAVPAEFRVSTWDGFDRALTAGHVWPWLAATVALAVIVLR